MTSGGEDWRSVLAVALLEEIAERRRLGDCAHLALPGDTIEIGRMADGMTMVRLRRGRGPGRLTALAYVEPELPPEVAIPALRRALHEAWQKGPPPPENAA